jgi:hypothetical protein
LPGCTVAYMLLHAPETPHSRHSYHSLPKSSRCGRQTAFGVLRPGCRCAALLCHTQSHTQSHTQCTSTRGSLRGGSCTCLERDHACILAAPVGLARLNRSQVGGNPKLAAPMSRSRQIVAVDSFSQTLHCVCIIIPYRPPPPPPIVWPAVYPRTTTTPGRSRSPYIRRTQTLSCQRLLACSGVTLPRSRSRICWTLLVSAYHLPHRNTPKRARSLFLHAQGTSTRLPTTRKPLACPGGLATPNSKPTSFRLTALPVERRNSNRILHGSGVSISVLLL